MISYSKYKQVEKMFELKDKMDEEIALSSSHRSEFGKRFNIPKLVSTVLACVGFFRRVSVLPFWAVRCESTRELEIYISFHSPLTLS